MRRSLQPAMWLAILTVGLGLVLVACSSGTGSGANPDTTPPSLSITSSATSSGVTYHLTGKTSDNIGATKITYTVNGGAAKTVDLSGGTFDVSITLTPGVNTIVVTVYDAAGNKTTKTIKVTYTPPANDSLALTVNAPSGVSGDITVTGPNSYSHAVTATTTLSSLADGTYTVAATSVTSGGTTYDPTPASQTVDLSGGNTGVATVDYQPTGTGSLTVTVSGLPTGANGDVSVTGPNGFSQTVKSTQALIGLAPGTYTVTPNAVTINLVYWEGTANPSSVTVTAGANATSDVTYQAHYGFLAVDISGVPSGHTAGVLVTGPGGYQQTVSTTTTLNGLDPGSYTVTAPDITDQASGDVYSATVVGSPADVQAGVSNTVTVTVTYARTTDHLAVAVSGLPSGVNPDISVTGPGGYAASITSSGTTTLTGLADGSYTFTAANVTSGSTTYVPTPTSKSVSLSGTDGSASFVYSTQPTTGDLTVNVTGLLNGALGSIDISGPNGYSTNVTGTTTLSGVAAGTYTLTVNDVGGGMYDYTGSASPASVSVPAGGSASSTVTYQATTGSLKMTVSNLPGATAAGATLTTPSGSTIIINGSGTLDHLAPGTYTLATKQITGSDGELYDDVADHNTTITVTAGTQASKTLAYQQVSGDLTVNISGPTSGSVDVTAPGLYSKNVTQTTTLKGLYAGASGVTYNVAVNPVHGTNFDWAGSADHPSVLILAGQTSTVNVTYNATDGAIDVSVAGLPGGTNANVDLVAPNGTTVLLSGQTASFTKAYLPQGTYTLTVHTVSNSYYSYGLQGATTDKTVSVPVSNGVVATPNVQYQAYTGVLNVTVTSTATSGITPAVTVDGFASGASLPNYSKPVSALGLTTITGLAPETYQTFATAVSDARYDYNATLTPTSGSVNVTAGNASFVTVDYQPTDGAISVSFSGPVPTGSTYSATLTNGSYSDTETTNKLVSY
ncbi:MAG: hypothetical protein P8Y05_02755, partial [Deinococcales bacterium]